MIPPTRLDDDVARRRSSRSMRNPDERRGDLRAQLAAHRLAERRVAELCATPRARRASRPRWTSCTPTRSGVVARGDRRAPRRPLRGGGRARGAGRRARGPRGRHDRGRRDRDRLRRHRAAARRATSTARSRSRGRPATSSCAVSTDPDVPASGGAFAPVDRDGAEGCLVNARPPAAVAAGNVETSSRIVDVLFARVRPGGRRARAGSGHDEQRHARQRRASRTTRRSAAARARAPTRTGRRASTSRCRTR